jgi:hypothetical protein
MKEIRIKFVVEHFDVNGKYIGCPIGGSFNENITDEQYYLLANRNTVTLSDGSYLEAYIPID